MKETGLRSAGGRSDAKEEEGSMQAHKLTLTAFLLGAALVLGTQAKAADLPESGTIKIHGAHKGTIQAVQVGENHSMGNRSNWGVTYNESGSGPLHVGAAMCTAAFSNVNGQRRGLPLCGVRFGRLSCALNRPTWSPVKGSSARVSRNRL